MKFVIVWLAASFIISKYHVIRRRIWLLSVFVFVLILICFLFFFSFFVFDDLNVFTELVVYVGAHMLTSGK